MDNPEKEMYEPPAVEMLTVTVELGFEGSDTSSTLPTWGSEDGYWQ